jgi:hypothetical protein
LQQQLILWLIWNVLLATAALRNNPFSSACAGSRQNGVVCLKQQAVIEFLVVAKESVTNIHRQLKTVYGDSAVDKSTASHWASQIAGSEKGQVELSDAPHSGWPTTAVTPALLRADELIRKDRRITTSKPATELSVSKGSVKNITDALGYAKVCACWVPRSLTDDHKTLQKEVCSDLLSCCEAYGESFLLWIVTGDETWIHHFEPETKNSQWNGIIQLLIAGRSLRLLLQQGKSWPLVSGMQKG